MTKIKPLTITEKRCAKALADAVMQLSDATGGNNHAMLDIFDYDDGRVYIQTMAAHFPTEEAK